MTSESETLHRGAGRRRRHRHDEPPAAEERRQRHHVARAAGRLRRGGRRPGRPGRWCSPGPADAFCSGADLADAGDVAGRPGDPYLVHMRALGRRGPAGSTGSPSPPSPRSGGVAAGAGMSLALGCDLVVASDTARFSQIFAKRGLSVDFGSSWLLPRLDRPPPGQGDGLLRRHPLGRGGGGLRAGQPGGPRADELDAFVDGWARRLAAGSAAGPVDDQDAAQQLVRRLHGPGPRGRGPVPGGQLRHARTRPKPCAPSSEKREPRFEGR